MFQCFIFQFSARLANIIIIKSGQRSEGKNDDYYNFKTKSQLFINISALFCCFVTVFSFNVIMLFHAIRFMHIQIENVNRKIEQFITPAEEYKTNWTVKKYIFALFLLIRGLKIAIKSRCMEKRVSQMNFNYSMLNCMVLSQNDYNIFTVILKKA